MLLAVERYGKAICFWLPVLLRLLRESDLLLGYDSTGGDTRKRFACGLFGLDLLLLNRHLNKELK